MTDTSSLLTTHSTPQPFPVTVPSQASPIPNGSLSDTNAQDEEDYTIKCICAYADDDGNTVLCEKCDTWQHIDCYYTLFGQIVPDVHFCADCDPRILDPKRATERQKRRREQNDDGDRKVKRPASKSHKKKIKEATVLTDQPNGWHSHDRQEPLVNGKEQPHTAKKPKHSHRASGSIASVNGHAGGEARKRAFSTIQSYPSPSKSPQDLLRFPAVPVYTTDFLELYDRDEGKDSVSRTGENVYTIPASNKLSLWKSDHTLLPNGEKSFSYSDLPLDPQVWPKVTIEVALNNDFEIGGKHPSWRLVRAGDDIKKEDLVGEVRGQVGLLEEYCHQESSANRWNELYHPDPFVFFHPLIPIYIDSRREGTEFRYLRRSCQPNVTLKTFITPDGQFHHCFVASKAIVVGTELTTSWYLHPHVFNNTEGLPWDEEALKNTQISWASKVLANFGDCACDRSRPCPLANLDRRYPSRPLDAPTKQLKSKRKAKNKHTISPQSTGQATNSRAGSETIKEHDDDDQFDRRSTSTSSRSHDESRDGTPANIAVLDAHPVLGDALTARERRKIAAVEKQFEKAEQGTHERKKKKRTSGGSTLNTPNANVSRQLGFNSASNPATPDVMQAVPNDVRAIRPLSGSPPPLDPSFDRNSPFESPCRPMSGRIIRPGSALPRPTSRPSYVNVSVQTDPEEPDGCQMPPPKRRKFVTHTQRLLKRIVQDRTRYEQQRNSAEAGTMVPPMIVPRSPGKQHHTDHDVEMEDVEVSPMSSIGQPASSGASPEVSPKAVGWRIAASPPFSMPSQAAHSRKPYAVPIVHRLHLSSLPPVPSFTGLAPSATVTPPSGPALMPLPTIAQSPTTFGIGTDAFPGLSGAHVTSPSPVRKKMSLGDYMKQRHLSATSAVEKTSTQANPTVTMEDRTDQFATPAASNPGPSSMTVVKPDDSINQEAAATLGVEAAVVEDTTWKDDSDYSPPVVSSLNQAFGDQAPAKDSISDAPPTSALDAIANAGPGNPPEVESILAQLRQMAAEKARPRSDALSG